MSWMNYLKLTGGLGTAGASWYYVRKHGKSFVLADTKNQHQSADSESSQLKSDEIALTLKHVQVFCRHGARTPIGSTPGIEEVSYNTEITRDVLQTLFDVQVKILGTDKGRPSGKIQENYEKKSRLKGGAVLGTLTGYGQYQMYEFGKLLRNQYDNLISKEFNSDEIICQSTNIDRTIASLRCVLAGLFGKKELNSKGPITISVRDDMDEVLFPNSHNCKVVRQIVHAAMIHYDDMAGIMNDRLVVEKVLGIDSSITRKLNFIHIRDDLVARQTHGYRIPPILLPYMDMIEKNAVRMMEAAFSGQSKAEKTLALRVNVGLMVEMTLNKIEQAAHNKSKDKLCLYSTHDSTLVSLLCSLDIFDDKWPPFAADVRFELYEDTKGKHWVKVLYLGKDQIVRGCKKSLVTLEEFQRNMKPMSIDKKEYSQICNSNPLEKIAKGLLVHEAGEVESKEDKEDSDKPAGM